MISTLIKVSLLGLFATIAAKTGITIFYEIFPPENRGYVTLDQAIPAALIGIIFASPFLFFLVKSVNWKKKIKGKLLRRAVKVNNNKLIDTCSFFDKKKNKKENNKK